MTKDQDALLTIQELMDGQEWTPATLESIAEVLRNRGYRVRDTEEYVAELDKRSMSSWSDEELKRYSVLTGQCEHNRTEEHAYLDENTPHIKCLDCNEWLPSAKHGQEEQEP